MMSEQDLVEMLQIAVEDLSQDHPVALENHDETDDADKPERKRQRLEISCLDTLIKSLLYSINQTVCLRLDNIETKLQTVEATCKSLEEKLDILVNKNHGPIQVPMVAGSPLGATQTWNKVRCVVPQTNVIVSNDRPKMTGQEDLIPRAADSLENLLSNTVPGRRQNTILVKVPGPEDSHNEDVESGSETSDSVSNSGQTSGQSVGNNVTLITLNSEEDFPNGTWLGDENNPEMRVRCPISESDMLHISSNCRTAEKMALTLLDYLFHREIQAVSNLSGQSKHGKKQLDPLMIYGIRCHLFYKFGITESDWYRIKQSIDSKCRTAWRRKQRGQSLAVKSFSRRTPDSSSFCTSDLSSCKRVALMSGQDSTTIDLTREGIQSNVSSPTEAQQAQQTLHYALANAQHVQIHRIGEDGQVQMGNLQIHQLHVDQDCQVLRGTQLIAVASGDPNAAAVEETPLQTNDIQVQYVQLAPVTDQHTATVQSPHLFTQLSPPNLDETRKQKNNSWCQKWDWS